MTGHERFRGWSAAYLLGALEASERFDFEAHLDGCESCRREVAFLAPLPGLLARAHSLDAEQPPPRIVDDAVARARSEWRALARSRRRWRWVAGAAAVAALIALVISLLPPPTPLTATALAVEPGGLAAGEIVIDSRPWGTAIHLDLADLPERERYIAWLVDTAGQVEQIASWGPTAGGRARVECASSVEMGAVARVVVTSPDGDDVLLTAHRPPPEAP